MPEQGDIVYIVGRPSTITEFFKYDGRYQKQVKSAVIIGGGRIAYYLGNTMSQMGIHIKIIEISKKRCMELDERLPDCTIIHGDGTNEDILAEEHIEKAGAVIAATGRDEQNLLVALFAARMNVEKVIAKINRGNYDSVINDLGIDSIISPKIITTARIVQYVRAMKNSISSDVESIHEIADGKAEALEFMVREGSRNLGKPFRDIRFKKNFLVAAIVRKGRLIIPSGSDCIQARDNVIVVSTASNVNDLDDIFEN